MELLQIWDGQFKYMKRESYQLECGVYECTVLKSANGNISVRITCYKEYCHS